MSLPVLTPNGVSRTACEPNNIGEMIKLAEWVKRSGLCPTALKRPEDVFMVLVKGRELGLTAMQSLSSIHVVEGRICLSSQLMMGLVLASGKCLRFDCLKSTDSEATYETARRDLEGEATVMTWTMAQAKAAGLDRRPNWQRYPAAMLRARCIAHLCRERYPDVVGGIYTPEEAREGEKDPELHGVDVHGQDVDATRGTIEERREARELTQVLQWARMDMGDQEFETLKGDLRGWGPAEKTEIAERYRSWLAQEILELVQQTSPGTQDELRDGLDLELLKDARKYRARLLDAVVDGPT